MLFRGGLLRDCRDAFIGERLPLVGLCFVNSGVAATVGVKASLEVKCEGETKAVT